MRKGFTLVELSIVLVIIGLLIGGILVAQSMIGTAKIQALIRQVGQFDAALANFKTKYNQLPGDTKLMGMSLGNNNGAIEGGCGNYNWSGELGKYWADLATTGLISNNGANYVDDSAGAGFLTTNTATKIPTAAAGNKASFLIVNNTNVSSIHYYFIGTPISGQGCGGIGTSSSFTPSDALAVDQKLDDGFANNGNVIGTDKNTYSTYRNQGIISEGTSCTTIIGGASYLTSSKSIACSLMIQMGSQTGDPL